MKTQKFPVSDIYSSYIIDEILQKADQQIKAQLIFKDNNYRSTKIYQQFFDNLRNESNYATKMKKEDQSLQLQKPQFNTKTDSEPVMSLSQKLVVKINTRLTSQNSKQSLKSKQDYQKSQANSPRKSRDSHSSKDIKIQAPQRKKYFSQYNKKPQNRFVKLKLRSSVDQNQNDSQNEVEKVQNSMRTGKIVQAIIQRGKSLTVKKKVFRKSKSLPAEDFPLLDNVCTLKYNLNYQKKQTKRQKNWICQINVKNEKSKKYFNPQQKSRLQLLRQKDSKSFFQRYHQKYDSNSLKEEQKMLKQADCIKILDDIQNDSMKKSKQKKSLEKNKFQAQRKSLTILGGRQRRCSKMGIFQGQVQYKLPQIKNYLKLQNREKQNIPKLKELKIQEHKNQKIVVNNKKCLGFLLKCDEEDQKGKNSQKLKPHYESIYSKKMDQDQAPKMNELSDSQQQSMTHESQQNESETISSIHLEIFSRR